MKMLHSFVRHLALMAAGWLPWRWTAPFVRGISPLDGKSGTAQHLHSSSAHWWAWWCFHVVLTNWNGHSAVNSVGFQLEFQTQRVRWDWASSQKTPCHCTLNNTSAAFRHVSWHLSYFELQLFHFLVTAFLSLFITETAFIFIYCGSWCWAHWHVSLKHCPPSQLL